ncbi:MAG TPA: hypothetical protein ENK09_08710 [Nitrospirae bacterium]|nr:hypothetical protein [Nitrospirota bacterium]
MKLFTTYIVILLQAILFPAIINASEQSLTIIYTGAMEGELEPCGCSPGTDFGGVARFAGYIKENKETLSPYVLIDAGNFSAKDTPQGRLKTETMLKSFKVMNYDVVALMGREESLPEQFLLPLIERYKIPAISDSSSYGSALHLKRGDFELNITVDPGDYQEGMLNILLTDRPLSEVRLLEGWDIVILSSGEILEEPVRTGGGIILSGYPKGKRLGVLTVKRDIREKRVVYQHTWQRLGRDVKDDPDVRKIIEEYNTSVGRLSSSSITTLTEGPYVGISRCAECHQPYMDSWVKTGHARALSSLSQKGKQRDPECLSCHTVGFGKEGGFVNIEATPDLANVQCEACHGPGRAHLQDYSRPMSPITKDTCMKCHTPQNSPDFNYRKYLERIKH